jgi:hypothetical protein
MALSLHIPYFISMENGLRTTLRFRLLALPQVCLSYGMGRKVEPPGSFPLFFTP